MRLPLTGAITLAGTLWEAPWSGAAAVSARPGVLGMACRI